jgi:ribosomal protein L14E/L6E/L27E
VKVLEKGEIVYSTKGRDAGRIYVVVDICEGFVYICNGELRPLEKPKRKNITHVKSTNIVSDLIKGKLQNMQLNNRELHNILSKIGMNKPSLEIKED